MNDQIRVEGDTVYLPPMKLSLGIATSLLTWLFRAHIAPDTIKHMSYETCKKFSWKLRLAYFENVLTRKTAWNPILTRDQLKEAIETEHIKVVDKIIFSFIKTYSGIPLGSIVLNTPDNELFTGIFSELSSERCIKIWKSCKARAFLAKTMPLKLLPVLMQFPFPKNQAMYGYVDYKTIIEQRLKTEGV